MEIRDAGTKQLLPAAASMHGTRLSPRVVAGWRSTSIRPMRPISVAADAPKGLGWIETEGAGDASASPLAWATPIAARIASGVARRRSVSPPRGGCGVLMAAVFMFSSVGGDTSDGDRDRPSP